jgi:tetrahydromethanopterin S-methyltransferase subunit B
MYSSRDFDSAGCFVAVAFVVVGLAIYGLLDIVFYVARHLEIGWK